ncbi:MAG: ABC transporter ATP-binding protein [Gemmatimonadetes bacterium]|nr:ABC transporter ATP-binding protein [Gemmatimonadota bacterium]
MEEPVLHVDLEKSLDAFDLRLRLEVNHEIMVLFGPSGAGKSMTLRSIAGLVTPAAGEIRLGEHVFFSRHRSAPPVNLPARKRRVGFVFQHYALFPHMTAVENVAYSMWRRSGARERAVALLESMRLQHLADRYPREMSGGQQQRVAVARALASEPQILLLDEPFSALDAATRERLHRDLRRLQRELGLVVLVVTHNLEDAFAVGDRLAVVRDGEVHQVGSVEEVFRRPTSFHAAETMGVRNLFQAQVKAVSAEALMVDWEGLTLETPAHAATVGEDLPVYIRPEDIKMLYPDRGLSEGLKHNVVEALVVSASASSGFRVLHLELPNGHELEARFPLYAYGPLELDAGRWVRVSLRKESLVVLHGPVASLARTTPAPGR